MPQAPIDSEVPRIQFDWLVRLRWWATGVETLAIVAVDQGLEADLPLVPLAALVALGLLTNVAAQWWRRQRPEVGERAIGNLLALDVLLLTGVLALTGGPFNPFSFLYLVHISLAAVLLGTRWTWGIAGLSILCSAALFLTLLGPDSGWFDEDNLHMRHMRMHLYGMWVAAAVAAVFIVYFVSRIRTSLLQREAELAAARLKALQAEKFASLATLAGGAAHELATPLSTIAVVSKELERSLAERSDDAENLDDVRLIRGEVERCRQILQALTAEAGQGPGEVPERIELADLLQRAVAPLAPQARIDVGLAAELQHAQVEVPSQALALALRGLVKNAVQASDAGQPVEIRVLAEGQLCRIEVRDRGQGMAPELAARAGEPFMTTKPPGQGMGLGIYLARTIVERCGGSLAIDSVEHRGTTAIARLPLCPPPQLLGAARG